MVWLNSQYLLDALLGFHHFAVNHIRVTNIQQSFYTLSIKFKHTPVAVQCCIGLAQDLQYRTEVVVRLDIVGFECDRLAVAGQRSVELPMFFKCMSQGVVHFG